MCVQGLAPAVEERLTEWHFPRSSRTVYHPKPYGLKSCDRLVRLRLADSIAIRHRPAALRATLAQLAKLQVECGVLVLEGWGKGVPEGSGLLQEMRGVFEEAQGVLPHMQLLDRLQPWGNVRVV